eukprot:6664767-Alexandrium_andersonii.AAC.1
MNRGKAVYDLGESASEEELHLQDMAKEASLQVEPGSTIDVDDADIEEITDFRGAEEPSALEGSESSDALGAKSGGEQLRGDIAGTALDPELVRAARAEEIRFMGSWHIRGARPASECHARTGKRPISGRWADRNKGGAAVPNVRSGYVAKGIAFYKGDSTCAATPPLEALRLLLSDLATRRRVGAYRRRRGNWK